MTGPEPMPQSSDPPRAAAAAPGPAGDRSSRRFAHASEAELARILDFYDVAWTYEPDTFPIGWNLDGDVVESFSPDFYLPDLDLYIELTTLKQKLVRKKNRKLRRLRELYPDIRIKLFYARDFRMLLLKFGRMALVDELTGTTGQATPPRAAPIPGAPSLPVRVDAPGPVTRTLVPTNVTAAAVLPTGEPGARPVPLAEQRGRRRGRRRRRAGEPGHAQAGSVRGDAPPADDAP
jgi:hypothetical protein